MDVPAINQIPTQLLVNPTLFSLGDAVPIVHQFTLTLTLTLTLRHTKNSFCMTSYEEPLFIHASNDVIDGINLSDVI